MSACAHSWKPVPNWHARYRCEWCMALAYRNLVNGGVKGVPVQMSVYICERCPEPAVQAGKRPQRCAAHAKPPV